MGIHTNQKGKNVKIYLMMFQFETKGGNGQNLQTRAKSNFLQFFFARILLREEIVFVLLVIEIEKMENKRMTWGELHTG